VIILMSMVAGCDCVPSFWGIVTGDTDSSDTTSDTVQKFVPSLPEYSGEEITVSYEWEFREGSGSGSITHPFNLVVNIPAELYTYYSSLERVPVPDYSVYVTHSVDDAFLQTVADSLRDLAEQKGFDSEETVNFIASFVQNPDSIAYALEGEEGEYPKYPVETLKEKEGDCEDSTILLGALFELVDYEVIMVSFPAQGDNAGHVGLGIAGDFGGSYYTYEGKRYYYLETTDLWTVGDLPDDYTNSEATLYEVAPVAAMLFTYSHWKITDSLIGPDTIDIQMTMRNWGTADAEDVHIRASFDGDSWYSSDTFDLQAGYEGTQSLLLDLPSDADIIDLQLIYQQQVADDAEIELNN